MSDDLSTGRPGRMNASDVELIHLVEGHNQGAVEELYRRHMPGAVQFARRLVGNDFDADDICSDAFLKVIGAIQRGKGPQGPFRPYLLTAVRTSAADHWSGTRREEPVQDPAETPDDEQGYDRILQEQDLQLAAVAFTSLPARWQTVLWHVDVEGEPPRRVGPLLGLEPNAVSAVAARARKGLRQAYLEAYVGSSVRESCKPYLPLLAKSVAGGLSSAEDLRLQDHLEKCVHCSAAIAALTDVRSTMRRAVGPWILGLAPGSLLLPTGATGTAGTGSASPAPQAAAQGAAHSAGMGIGAWAAAVAIVACLATAAVAVGMGLGTTNSTSQAGSVPGQAGPGSAGGPANRTPGADLPDGTGTGIGSSSSNEASDSAQGADAPGSKALQAPLPVTVRDLHDPTASPTATGQTPLPSKIPEMLSSAATGTITLPGASTPGTDTVSPTAPPVSSTSMPTATRSAATADPTPTATLTPAQTRSADPTPTQSPPATVPPTSPGPTPTPTPEDPCPWWWWFCPA